LLTDQCFMSGSPTRKLELVKMPLDVFANFRTSITWNYWLAINDD